MTLASDLLDSITSVIEPLVSLFSVDSFVLAISAAALFSIGLVFAWWAVRRVIAIIMNAFRGGRLKM